VVAAAGAANAATAPQATDLGAVSSLAGASMGNTLDNGAQKAAGTAGQNGSRLVGTAIPASGRAVGAAGKAAAPAAQNAAGSVADGAGDVVGRTAADNQLPGLPFGG
jgi:hypothetical protein